MEYTNWIAELNWTALWCPLTEGADKMRLHSTSSFLPRVPAQRRSQSSPVSNRPRTRPLSPVSWKPKPGHKTAWHKDCVTSWLTTSSTWCPGIDIKLNPRVSFSPAVMLFDNKIIRVPLLDPLLGHLSTTCLIQRLRFCLHIDSYFSTYILSRDHPVKRDSSVLTHLAKAFQRDL